MHVRLFVLRGDGNVHSLLHALQEGVGKAKESDQGILLIDRHVSRAGSGVFLDFVAYHTVEKTDTDDVQKCLIEVVDVASYGMDDHLLRFEQSTVGLREIEGRGTGFGRERRSTAGNRTRESAYRRRWQRWRSGYT